MTGSIGYACSYTPLAFFDAAGFDPYRILPIGGASDQAGMLLHDNLCPHVKRILDRALDNDLPELSGIVLMHSCDAMRRLADVWKREFSKDNLLLLDLPVLRNERSISYFEKELQRFIETLSAWSGQEVTEANILASIKKNNKISALFSDLRKRVRNGTFKGGQTRLQSLYNDAATQPFSQSIETLIPLIEEPEVKEDVSGLVPLYVFGNVLPMEQSFELFTECGVRIVSDDLCTGSRQFDAINLDDQSTLDLNKIARSILSRPLCSRTMIPDEPNTLTDNLIAQIRASGAKGAVGHTVKFCDPYLGRFPYIRRALKEADIPLLVLEGDCTIRSMGQQKTRIEAFAEMLR